MADDKRKLRNQDIQGLKYFRELQPLLARLHEVGAARDVAGNRELFMDQYCTLILIWLFSPLVDSLRGLQQASELDKVRKKFGVGRSSLGSLSESVTIFDPEPLKAIAAELSHQLPAAGTSPFDAVGQQLTAVDGSVINTVARVAKLAWLPKAGGNSQSAYRLHTHFEVLRGVPTRFDATPAKPKGADDERAVLEKTIQPDRCYLIDRGYAKFTLWNAIVAAESSYVCRVRDNSVYVVEQTHELSAADRAAGVLSDEVVILGQSRPAEERPAHPVRLITIAASRHTSRGKYRGGSTGQSCDGTLRLATNRLDLPAELIGQMYRLRWLIELFFRMFKQLLGCRHLLSTKHNGVEIQAYCALIACLLILLYTGRTPTKRTFEMISFYLVGWASLEELERHIEKINAAK
jgi:IS4 transposase